MSQLGPIKKVYRIPAPVEAPVFTPKPVKEPVKVSR